MIVSKFAWLGEDEDGMWQDSVESNPEVEDYEGVPESPPWDEDTAGKPLELDDVIDRMMTDSSYHDSIVGWF